MGSANELEYHLLLAHDLDLVKPENHNALENDTVEVKKMLASLLQKLRADS